MPHISVEVTPRLAAELDFDCLFRTIHRRLADAGQAVLTDFKSRAHIADRHLAGDDPGAEFVVARFMTTNPRPEAEQRAMAQVVHDVLRDAIAKLDAPFWWQCCVLNESFERGDYIKTDSSSY